MKKTRYYFSVSFRIILYVVVFLCFYAAYRMSYILMIALKWENSFWGYGDLIAYFLGLFFGILIYAFFLQLKPYFDKIDKLITITKTKSFPLTEQYGRDYKQPKPEDFGIIREEFLEYNSRPQFFLLKFICTYGLLFSSFIFCAFNIKYLKIWVVIILLLSIIVAVLFDKVFNRLNKKKSKQHKYFLKINSFQESLKLYYKIREEHPYGCTCKHCIPTSP